MDPIYILAALAIVIVVFIAGRTWERRAPDQDTVMLKAGVKILQAYNRESTPQEKSAAAAKAELKAALLAQFKAEAAKLGGGDGPAQ